MTKLTYQPANGLKFFLWKFCIFWYAVCKVFAC